MACKQISAILLFSAFPKISCKLDLFPRKHRAITSSGWALIRGRGLLGSHLGHRLFAPGPGKSSRRIWWTHLSPGGSFTRIINASCLLQTGCEHPFQCCLGSAGGKCFLKGESTYPGSQTVPVKLVPLLMVPTFMLRHNLIWMLNHRVTLLRKTLPSTAH